jgi:hypothetical protein
MQLKITYKNISIYFKVYLKRKKNHLFFSNK